MELLEDRIDILTIRIGEIDLSEAIKQYREQHEKIRTELNVLQQRTA